MLLPLPPYELQARVGSVAGPGYEAWGHVARTDILGHLPWPLDGKRVLDFGCGAGRVLRHLREANLAGCDIDAPSIDWVRQHMPWVDAFLVSETPRIPRPDGSYDLVLALSVFTHLVDTWEGWLLEIRRVLGRDGLLLATFLGPGMYAEFEKPRDGIVVVQRDRDWDAGGPVVLHRPEWIQASWGRWFEIVEMHDSGFAKPDDRATGHGVVLMRRR